MYLEDIVPNDYERLTGKDNAPVTVIEPDGTEHEINAQHVRIDAQVDPDTGVMFREPRSTITLRESKLPAVDYQDLRVRFSDANRTVEARVGDYLSDHTIGFVNLILENVTDVV